MTRQGASFQRVPRALSENASAPNGWQRNCGRWVWSRRTPDTGGHDGCVRMVAHAPALHPLTAICRAGGALDVCFIHPLPVLQGFPWERHAPAWLLEPGWSPTLPGEGTGAGLTKWTSRACRATQLPAQGLDFVKHHGWQREEPTALVNDVACQG